MNPTARNWMVTINETNDGRFWERPESLPKGIRYMCGQIEMGKENNRKHWQLFVSLENPERRNGVKDKLKCNWANCIVSKYPDACADYCTKDETCLSDRFELGVFDKRKKSYKALQSMQNSNNTTNITINNMRISDNEILESLERNRSLRNSTWNQLRTHNPDFCGNKDKCHECNCKEKYVVI